MAGFQEHGSRCKMGVCSQSETTSLPNWLQSSSTSLEIAVLLQLRNTPRPLPSPEHPENLPIARRHLLLKFSMSSNLSGAWALQAFLMNNMR